MKLQSRTWLIGWLLITLIASSACTMITAQGRQPAPETVFGDPGTLEQGTARTFAELNPDGSPVRMGIAFDQATLEDLPTEPNLESRCFDASGDGALEADECIGDYELILALPTELTQNADIPFQWAAIAWNPHGHMPPIWTAPHFDFHFYTVSQEEVQAIRPGPCGEMIHCEDLETATRPVPAPYLPANYVDVGAAVPAMGNHLVDMSAPELAEPPQAEFTHSFVYGSYDGHITFYEPMITHDFLLTQPDECKTINQPEAWEISGYYPTEYCIRYQESNQEEYTVSLEKFVYREAS